MDKYENLVVLRNIFYKCFFIGLIFAIIAAGLYYPCKCLVVTLYHTNIGIRWDIYSAMWVLFVGLIKTIIVFLFLVPALAIHWAAHCYKKKHSI